VSLRIVTTPLGAPVAWPEPRSGGVSADLLVAFVAASDTPAILERLKHPDALVVTTGQQPGLLTGPLYTIHKALSAVALARLCEERWKRPVIPVFWAAGGDHDFAEGNHTAWTTAEGRTVTVTLRERAADAPLTPLYREPVGPEIEAVLERLAHDLPDAPFRQETLDLFRRWYRPESTLAASCAHVLAELLSPFGIPVFDATHPAAKAAQAPVLLAALERAEELDRLLVERNSALVAQEHDPGVAVGESATLVMYEGRLGRDRLVLRTPGFVTRRSHESLSLADLQRLAREDPGRLSPNVLLRPAVESAILPTVGYVGGPGELRYLTLAEAVYQPLGIVQQVAEPRWSGILVDATTDRALEKFGATLEELLAPGERLESRVVRRQLPPEVPAALSHLRESIASNYEILANAARDIDPTIERTMQNLERRAAAGTEDAEKRLVNHLKRRQQVELEQIARAREFVLPLGKPQERVVNIAPWFARYGPDLLADLLGVIRNWYAAALEGRTPPG